MLVPGKSSTHGLVQAEGEAYAYTYLGLMEMQSIRTVHTRGEAICSHRTLEPWEHTERISRPREGETPCEREGSHTPEAGTMFWVGI